MLNKIHTVLGASGSTGRAVIQELQKKNLLIRAVCKTTIIEGVITVNTDLLSEQGAIKAIQNSSFVYLCVGLPYQSKIWQLQWPQLLQNVLTACKKAKAKLIFFDNVYMYGPAPLAIPFTEKHHQHPNTKKGKARKTIPHTYAYSGDNGRALVTLALDNSTYGQVWHLPVGQPITFEEVNKHFNTLLGTNYKLGYTPKFLRKVLAIFLPIIVEVEELNYQFEQHYEMSSKKFMKHFPDFQVTSYEEGFKAMLQSFGHNF